MDDHTKHTVIRKAQSLVTDLVDESGYLQVPAKDVNSRNTGIAETGRSQSQPETGPSSSNSCLRSTNSSYYSMSENAALPSSPQGLSPTSSPRHNPSTSVSPTVSPQHSPNPTSPNLSIRSQEYVYSPATSPKHKPIPDRPVTPGTLSTYARTKHAPKIVYSHSEDRLTTSDGSRPICPSLPYSPYQSPSGSPRLRRQPTKETRSLSISDTDGYTQLNQYKLKDEIGKACMLLLFF